MSGIMIASGGVVEVICLKCLANRAREERGDGGQRYSFHTPHGEYVWDVEKALRLIDRCGADKARRGGFVTFGPEEMAGWLSSLQEDALDAEHARHVDPRQPGLMAQAWDCKQECVAGVLIDGTHRMLSAYMRGMPFHALLLTHEESESCTISRPILRPEIIERMRSMEAFPTAPVGG